MPTRLPPECMAAIAAAAVEDGGRGSQVAIAKQFDVAVSAVYAAVKRIRAAGGWYTPLTETTCRHCGQPMFAGKGKATPRNVHHRCRAAREKALSNAWKRFQWTQPEGPGLQQFRIETAEKHARHWSTLRQDRREELLHALHVHTARDQALTLDLAENHRTRWSSDEEEYLLSQRHLPTRELALDLGRTFEAIRSHLKELAKRGVKVPPSPWTPYPRDPADPTRRLPRSGALDNEITDFLPTFANQTDCPVTRGPAPAQPRRPNASRGTTTRTANEER